MAKSCFTQKNIETLAELMFLGRVGKAKMPAWKETTPEVRAKGVKDTELYLDQMSKMNFEPRPLGEFRELRKQLSLTKEKVSRYIKSWIQDHVEHPKNLAEIFPCEELGHNLVRDFGENQKEQTGQPSDVSIK